MAPRIGFSLRTLRQMDPAACETDVRLVWKKDDETNIGFVTSDRIGTTFVQGIHVCGTRELRLLARQMLRHADNIERVDDDVEEVLPSTTTSSANRATQKRNR